VSPTDQHVLSNARSTEAVGFFIHVMRTAGTTFAFHVRRTFREPRAESWARPILDDNRLDFELYDFAEVANGRRH
jgi:hypothetical protein